jgi:hypothetical protein
MIVVVVDSMAEREFLCADPPLFEGLEHIQSVCDDLIRFTHVFAPSPLLQPQLASIVSGQEVSQHGVTTNGPQALSNTTVTLAEDAVKQKMRTALFSGGVPLQAKFGMSQGYEVFSDGFELSPPALHIPFRKSVEKSLRWLDEEVRGRSFLMSFYVTDLLFQDNPEEETITDEFPKDRAGRLRAIYVALDQLIGALKQRQRWGRSHFVFLGLGDSSKKLDSINPLGSELLHSPLQIKLAKSVKTNLGDLSGEIVSYARLGRWLKGLISHRPSQGFLSFASQSDESWIPQQSHLWPWLGLSRYPSLGLRSKPYLFSLTDGVQVYESFTDRRELEPLSVGEQQEWLSRQNIKEIFIEEFHKECHIWQAPKQLEKLECGNQITDQSLYKDLELLINWAREKDESVIDISSWLQQQKKLKSYRLAGWLAAQSLRQRDWASLFELGKRLKVKPWLLISQLNFRENPSQSVSGCLQYFVELNKSTSDFYKNCQDSELRQVVEGLHSLRNKQRPSDGFWAQISSINKKRRAKIVNLQSLFKNDIQDPFDFSPSLAELYFFLPENSAFLNLLDLNKA